MERGWGHTRSKGCPQAGRGDPGQRLLLHEGGTEHPTPKYKDSYGVVGLRGVLADQAGSYISEPVGCFFPDPPLGIFRALLGQSSQAAEGISPWARSPQLWSHGAQQVGLCLWVYRTCPGKTVSLTPFFGQQRFLKPSSPGDQTGSGQKP